MEEAQAFVGQGGTTQPTWSISAGNSGVQKFKRELDTTTKSLAIPVLQASGKPAEAGTASRAAGGSNRERNIAGMHRDSRAPKRLGNAKQRSKALARAEANGKADLVDDVSDKTTSVVCTDGACSNNGKWNAVAGIGEPKFICVRKVNHALLN